MVEETTVVQTDMSVEEAKKLVRDRREAEEKAAAGMKSAAERVAPPEDMPRMRCFLCPTQPNTTFLVRPGTVVSFHDPNARQKVNLSREGDVEARFAGGILVTGDPEIIAWCEAHGIDENLHKAYHQRVGTPARSCSAKSGLCVDATHPQAEIWVELKINQIVTSRHDAIIPPGLDVDSVLRGEVQSVPTGGRGTSLVRSGKASLRMAEEERGK